MDGKETRRLARATRRIDGWLAPPAAAVFALVDEIQREHSVTGGIFEIGVHHGKSAVVLGQLLRPDETLSVCDLFGRQDLNASDSGLGDRATFERNMARHAPHARIQVFPVPSSELGTIDGPIRLFHVDGGHRKDEALGDIELAAECLHERGVIVVDDPYRADWPEVTEAIIAFLEAHADFVPILVGFNKVLLTRRACAGDYLSAFSGDRVWSFVSRHLYARKTVTIHGQDLPSFFLPVYGVSKVQLLAATWHNTVVALKQRVRHSRAGALALRLRS